MLISCDWLGEWRCYFCQPQAPLSLAEINAQVAEQGLVIAEDWRPAA